MDIWTIEGLQMPDALVSLSCKVERPAAFNRFYTPAINIVRVVMNRGITAE
jgi:hypothetical protein